MSIMFADPRPTPPRPRLARVQRPARAGVWQGPMRPVTPDTTPLGVRPFGEQFADLWWLSEMYRADRHPELYDDWQHDQMQADLERYLDATGMVALDCDGCHKYVIVHTHDDPCPNCTGRP